MDFYKHALILAMIERLGAHGSRTGKTHVIKGFFLGDAEGGLEQLFQFFLYKHGPYSTEIESNLEEMISYEAITVEPAFDGYGVILSPGDMADYVKRKAQLSPETQQAIDRVCAFINSKNVSNLERLATAAWIRTREGVQDSDRVAARLHELKPHVSVSEALQADQELSGFFPE